MKTTIKTLVLSLVITLASCNMFEEPVNYDFKISTALSIFSNNGHTGISTIVNKNNRIYTEYWKDSTKIDSTALISLMPAGSSFRTSVDDRYYVSSVFKMKDNSVVKYQFSRFYNLDPDRQLFYYKNGKKMEMDTTALGTIYAVDVNNGEVFAGYFSTQRYTGSGFTLSPTTPFYWTGAKNITKLPIPSPKSDTFRGVSCIHKSEKGDVYTGGLMTYPMYWKNTEVVKLEDLYGEVNQIISVGDDVYAVGFYNKQNSNSTGHTACYWKNGKRTELEDNAIAYSIFIDGSDVYVSGAKGRFDAEYNACYWKNGKRYNLEKTEVPVRK